MGVVVPCERSHWGLGGAAYGATKRVRSVPTRAWWSYADAAVEALSGDAAKIGAVAPCDTAIGAF
eukprot:5749526-Pyramimonas_sp.AAC.1